MRGDAALTARLLLRGAGLAGVVAALGGVAVVLGAMRPWSVALAEVSMLGGTDERTVALLRGVPGTVGGWATALAGVAVIGLGMSIALDRPPARARALLGATAVVAGAIAIVHLLVVPDPLRIAGQEAVELVALRDRLPVGVELELRSAAASGPWWVAGGALLGLVGAAAARDR